jgi:hypothetical protein
MATIISRVTKGSALTLAEQDANFANLNTDLIALQGSSPKLVAQSYMGWTRTADGATDASAGILASPVLPGGTMGLNSKLVIVTDWDVLAGNTKHLGVNFGGTNVGGAFTVVSPTLSAKILTEIQNLNNLTSQSAINAEQYGRAGAARIAAAIDTSSDVTIDFTGRWSANVAVGQTITLLGYSIYHYPGS